MSNGCLPETLTELFLLLCIWATMAGRFQGNRLCSFLGAGVCAAATPGHTIWTVWIIALVLFIFIWFLFGSYQIYSVYPPNYDKNTTASNSSKSSVLASPAPKRELGFTSEIQGDLSLNKTQGISSNWTLWLKTLALSSRRTNREQSNVQQARQTVAAAPYCNRAVYTFAFWTTTLVYALAGNALVMVVCLCGFMKCTDLFVKHLTT